MLMRLGELLFNGAEVPESVNGGGDQVIARNQLIGGKRIDQALGPDDADIKFNGLFRGILALVRVRYLENLRRTGEEVDFTYSFFSYRVIVKSFSWNLKQAYQTYYEITLEVIKDLTLPVTVAIPISISDAMQTAFTEALDIATLINNGSVTAQMAILGAALDAAGDLNSLTVGQITALTSAITNAGNAVQGAINSL